VDAELSDLWRQMVYQVAREISASVKGALRVPGPGRNYYRLDLRTARGDHLTILLNAAATGTAAAAPARMAAVSALVIAVLAACRSWVSGASSTANE
jgi:hypothetical protein